MVPVAVAQAERRGRQQAEREAAYWRGQAEARAGVAPGAPLPGQPAAPATPAAPVLTAQEQMAAIRAEQLALAAKYDDGQIRTAEWEAARQSLADQEWEIRSQQFAPPAPQVPIGEQLFEERETVRIEQQYPILGQLAKEDLEPLVAIAYREAAREGKPIEGSIRGTIALRERVAKLAVRNYGPGTAPASPQPPAAGAQHPNNGAADLAVNHPVNVSQLGAGPAGVGVTDEQALATLESLTEDAAIAYLNANPGLVNRAMARSFRPG